MIEIKLEEIFKEENVKNAIEYLQTKKDTSGVDRIKLSEIPTIWANNKKVIREEICLGVYVPGLVQEIEYLQRNGKRRNIIQMNSVDRLILRCITQKLQPLLEEIFCDNSYAYRVNRGTTVATRKVIKHINEKLLWVAEVDIKAFFDEIEHERMSEIINKYIADSKLCGLLMKFMKLSVVKEYEIHKKSIGLLQGSAISPMLSNLFLHELDCDLKRKGWRAVRYADNINIYAKTYEEALNKYNYLQKELRVKYKLQINQDKSGIYKSLERRYLGQYFKKSEKTGQIYVYRKRPEGYQEYKHWNKTALQWSGQNYHIINDGILTRKDYTILFENEEKKRYVPVEAAEVLNIHSETVFTSDFFKFVGKKKIGVNLFDKYGNYIGSFISAENNQNGKVMLKQAEAYLNERRRLEIAKAIIIAATHNMRANIRYYQKKRKTDSLGILSQQLTKQLGKITQAESVSQLMLVEARTRQMYFNGFKEIVLQEDFVFQKRTKRPPQDPINALISFGNTILYRKIATEIFKTNLDIRIAFLHSANSRRQSLQLDLAEIFKPIIVDRIIFSIINRNMLHAKEHFEKVGENGVYLNREGKIIFIKKLEEKLYQKLTINTKTYTYMALIRNEVRKFSKMIEMNEKYKPYKYH